MGSVSCPVCGEGYPKGHPEAENIEAIRPVLLTALILDVLDRSDRSLSSSAIATSIGKGIDEWVEHREVERICQRFVRVGALRSARRHAGHGSSTNTRRYYWPAEKYKPYKSGPPVLAVRSGDADRRAPAREAPAT